MKTLNHLVKKFPFPFRVSMDCALPANSDDGTYRTLQAMHPLTATRWDRQARSAEELAWKLSRFFFWSTAGAVVVEAVKRVCFLFIYFYYFFFFLLLLLLFPSRGRFFLYLWCMITIRWWCECGLMLLPFGEDVQLDWYVYKLGVCWSKLQEIQPDIKFVPLLLLQQDFFAI